MLQKRPIILESLLIVATSSEDVEEKGIYTKSRGKRNTQTDEKKAKETEREGERK